jgi:hypothetical protein
MDHRIVFGGAYLKTEEWNAKCEGLNKIAAAALSFISHEIFEKPMLNLKEQDFDRWVV